MKILRKLGATVILTSVLALSTLVGEAQTPPCTPPNPGQIDTPPCSAAPGDMGTPDATPTAPGNVGTPTAAGETSFTEIAADVLLNFLPLY